MLLNSIEDWWYVKSALQVQNEIFLSDLIAICMHFFTCSLSLTDSITCL